MSVKDAKGCEPGIRVAEGITRDIAKKIRSRKKASDDKSEKECWNAIYRHIFPGEDIPCPYFRTPQESIESLDSRTLTSIKEYLEREWPSLLRTGNDIRSHREDALERVISSIIDLINGGPLETGNNAPLTQPPSERQQGNATTFDNQGSSDDRQASTITAFPMLLQQQLPTDLPDQRSIFPPMNVERINVEDATLYSYPHPYHVSGGVISYSSTSVVSNGGFQEMENQYPEYHHNMAQSPNNPLAPHTEMSEEILVGQNTWNQPDSQYHMNNALINGGISYNGYNNFNGSVS